MLQIRFGRFHQQDDAITKLVNAQDKIVNRGFSLRSGQRQDLSQVRFVSVFALTNASAVSSSRDFVNVFSSICLFVRFDMNIDLGALFELSFLAFLIG
jgi:hypothetical protein